MIRHLPSNQPRLARYILLGLVLTSGLMVVGSEIVLRDRGTHWVDYFLLGLAFTICFAMGCQSTHLGWMEYHADQARKRQPVNLHRDLPPWTE